MKWEGFVSGAQSRNDVVLESLDGSFSVVAAVDVGWDQLALCCFVVEVLLKDLRAFIV